MAAHSPAPEPLPVTATAVPVTTVPPVTSGKGTHTASTVPAVAPPKPAPSALTLRIVRGPLGLSERIRILSEYNRLTGNRVPVQQFRRFTEQSPSGPAFHVFLETPGGRIAGHCALVPFPLQGPHGPITAAKEHYFFFSDEYRSQLVPDFPGSQKPAATLLLEQLYARASQQGWSPVIACDPAQPAPIHDALGCRAVDLPVRDCFFLLKPARACQSMDHLPLSTRIRLFAVGVGSSVYAACVSPFRQPHGFVRRSRVTDGIASSNGHLPRHVSISEDPQFVSWRYAESSYVRFIVNNGHEGHAIVAKGSPVAFLRVCQFRTPSIRSLSALVEKLIREARATYALGVRWSVYGDGPDQDRLVAELRKHLFFCVRRTRRILVSSPANAELLSPTNWNLADSLFTFDA